MSTREERRINHPHIHLSVVLATTNNQTTSNLAQSGVTKKKKKEMKNDLHRRNMQHYLFEKK